MARLSLRSVKAEITALGVQKVGYTAYYVDGTIGSNEYDGLTWETPFLTIQHAIDESESWAKIYVKAGSYSEMVTIPSGKENTQLIGEKQGTTIIYPAVAGYPLTINSNWCIVKSITAKTDWGGFAIFVSGDRNLVQDCLGVDAPISTIGDYNKIDSCIDDTCGFRIQGNYNEIHDCFVDGAIIGILVAGPTYFSKVYNNEIKNCTSTGIRLKTEGLLIPKYNSVFHNNLTGNVAQVFDDGNDNKWWENYYDDHIVDTNNDGLCDTPYTFTTGTDYTPVSKRNGWNQISLGTSASLGITVSNIFNLVNGILTLTETGGTITTGGALQTLYINNAPAGIFQPRKLLIDFTNHAIGDVMIIRTYYRLNATGLLIKQDEETIVGVQDPALITIYLEENRFGYEITIEKTVGANLTYDWEVIYKI